MSAFTAASLLQSGLESREYLARRNGLHNPLGKFAITTLRLFERRRLNGGLRLAVQVFPKGTKQTLLISYAKFMNFRLNFRQRSSHTGNVPPEKIVGKPQRSRRRRART